MVQKDEKMEMIMSIGLVLFGTVIGSYGAFFLKKGSDKFSLNPLELIKNYWVILGITLYALSTIPVIIALQYEDVSLLYPFVSLGYVWVVVLSIMHLKEKMNLWKWLGIVGIIVGVSLIGVGSV